MAELDPVDYFQQIDLENIRNSEAARKRKHELSVTRWKTSVSIFGIIAVASVACMSILALWLAFKGPNTQDQINREVRLECIEAGGTWLKLADDSSAGEYGTCVLGKVEEPSP